jgi:upstream activation factor subunit UAF30
MAEKAKKAPAKPAKAAAKAPAKAAKPAAKAAPKAAAKKPAAGKTNALQQPLTPSAELAAVVGAAPLGRGAVVSKVWEYIKAKNLQNPANKREILADDKLKKVFGKDKVTMFEMNKHLAAHLK